MHVHLAVTLGPKVFDAAVHALPDDTDLVEAVGPLIVEIQNQLRHYRQIEIPNWQDFDVITVLMGKQLRPYTYMRKGGYWPGEHSWTEMDDEKVDQLWERDRVTLVIRAGIPLPVPWTKGNRPTELPHP